MNSMIDGGFLHSYMRGSPGDLLQPELSSWSEEE